MVAPIGQMPTQIEGILSNIRQLREQFDGQNQVSNSSISNSVQRVNGDSVTSFKDTLSEAIEIVNNDMKTSRSLKTAFDLGDPNVTLEQVTIASQQASIGFEAMVQVRNKLIEAYKEIMSMPV